MKRFILIILIFISFCFPRIAKAEGEFVIDDSVSYTLEENGKAFVRHSIILENNQPLMYAKRYTLQLMGSSPYDIKAKDSKNTYKVIEETKTGGKMVNIEFPDDMVGKNLKREFEVSYTLDDYARKLGEVWEINMPKIGDIQDYRNYSLTLIIPLSFGDDAYMSPNPVKRSASGNYNIYYFNKESAKTGVSAIFGELQTYSFKINYHLDNPLSKIGIATISLPPDTNYQKVFYNKIEPKPTRVELDEDGNWIATYKLKAKENIVIETEGYFELFPKPRQIPSMQIKDFKIYTTPKLYWESDNENIKEIASGLGSPLRIYQYVIDKLDYNYSRVKPNIERLGALSILDQPGEAICMEYTDLFIALARAKEIPAREINGFAYSNDEKVEPLSLVSDVLHAWPEYYDLAKKSWVPVDPTWGDTTGGVDFFDKVDLRHITFVIHGIDSVKPFPPGSYKLGTQPQKDVFIDITDIKKPEEENIILSHKVNKHFFKLSQTINVTAENKTGQAYYYLPVSIERNGQREYKTIKYLLPFQKETFSIEVPFNFFGKNTPNEVIVSYKAQNIIVDNLRQEQIIITSLVLFVVLMIMGILLYTLYRLRKK